MLKTLNKVCKIRLVNIRLFDSKTSLRLLIWALVLFYDTYLQRDFINI